MTKEVIIFGVYFVVLFIFGYLHYHCSDKLLGECRKINRYMKKWQYGNMSQTKACFDEQNELIISTMTEINKVGVFIFRSTLLLTVITIWWFTYFNHIVDFGLITTMLIWCAVTLLLCGLCAIMLYSNCNLLKSTLSKEKQDGYFD